MGDEPDDGGRKMTLFYHGTPAQNTLLIAKDGAILSPWEQKIEYLHRCKEQEPDIYDYILKNFSKRGITDVEKIALELAKPGYAKREIEHRVKCVSLTSDLSVAAAHPRDVILGIELDSPPQHVLYVPRRVPLDMLKEVYLKETALPLENRILFAFERYKPIFKRASG